MLPTVGAFLLIIAFFAVERLLRRGQDAKRLERGAFDRGSTTVVAVAFLLTVLGLLVTLLLPITVAEPLRWLGLALMAAGLGLRVWAFRVLGRFYTRTLLITDQHRIVQDGPYHVVRHPGYLGILVLWLGAGLAAGSWIVLAWIALVMGIGYSYRIRIEEAMLVAAHGDTYHQYQASTWRLIPLLY